MTHRRSAPLRFALLAAGVVGLAAHLPAQDTPRPVVSTSAEEPGTGEAKGVVSGLLLRPNAELPFFVYLEEPNKQSWKGKKLTVQVAADPRGKQVLAEGVVDDLGRGERVRVQLKSAAPAPPPAPAAPPAAEKGQPPAPAAPKPPAGAPVPAALYVQVLDDRGQPFKDANGNDVKPVALDVTVQRPGDYLYAEAAAGPAGDGGYTLTVTLGDRVHGPTANKAPFRGPPADVKLDLRPSLVPGLDPASLTDGTFETVVAPNADKVVLVAKGLRFRGRPGRSLIAVTADGYDRAFVFETSFGGTAPEPFSAPKVQIDAPRYAVPGKPLSVRLEVFNDPAVGRPALEFFRAEEGPAELVTADLRTPRNRRATVRVGGEGELVFVAEVKDWVVPLNTAGVFGTRRLALTLNGAKDEKLITLDPTPPAGVQLLAVPLPPPPPPKRRVIVPPGALGPNGLPAGADALPGILMGLCAPCVPQFLLPPPKPAAAAAVGERPKVDPFAPAAIPKKWVRGGTIQLVGRAADPESKLAKVVFFLGAPPGPDGKLPAGAKAVEFALAPPPDDPTAPPAPTAVERTATFDLPDQKGPLTLGVRFVNGAGLVSEATVDITLVDPPTPPTGGTIEGRVTQGSTPIRPQPGLTVTLLDATGRPVLAATTDAEGKFKFEDLKPGMYTVYSVKPADGNARGFVPAPVDAGGITEVMVELKR